MKRKRLPEEKTDKEAKKKAKIQQQLETFNSHNYQKFKGLNYFFFLILTSNNQHTELQFQLFDFDISTFINFDEYSKQYYLEKFVKFYNQNGFLLLNLSQLSTFPTKGFEKYIGTPFFFSPKTFFFINIWLKRRKNQVKLHTTLDK
jgi:hypothetical protein